MNQWEEEGQRRYKTFVLANQIEFLSSKSNEESNEEPQTNNVDPFAKINVQNIPILDEDLPF